MSLTARIDEDIKAAMKAKDAEKLGALRMLKSSLKYAVIEKGTAGEAGLADADVITVIRKRIKQCQDAIEGFVQGGRAEQAAKEKAEVALLESYLPAALSAEELSALVRDALAAQKEAGPASCLIAGDLNTRLPLGPASVSLGTQTPRTPPRP
jgi:uncharacterized protein YqeY